MLLPVSLAVTCIKLLLLPSYKSTDFEVHRNWLAITSSLPLGQWYTEATSEWTLDYPPFFAWFELLLSKVAVLFDPEMLIVKNLNYSSPSTILFQRLSVIVTDIVFILGSWKCSHSIVRRKASQLGGISKEFVVFLLLACNVGLFIVDHIHFQYNGFLFGILLLSIGSILEGNNILGGFWFCVLLNMKHIYLYMAPAYFVYLLRSYCFTQNNRSGKFSLFDLSVRRLTGLAVVVIATFLLSLAPFLHQLPQLAERLFPFKRGLCHAYWAPNFWAVYNVVDKLGFVVAKRTGLLTLGMDTPVASMTGGLVQDIQHSLLPNIPPIATFVLTLCSMLPALVKLWNSPYSPVQFLRCLILCAWSSFLFGWHVHEKAILLVIIPLTLLTVVSRTEAKYFVLAAITGHFSLLPLLFTSQELFTKFILHLSFTLLVLKLLKQTHKSSILCKTETAYLLLSIVIFVYSELLHGSFGFMSRYPFLPLMIYSLYSSLGVISTYIRFYSFYLAQ